MIAVTYSANSCWQFHAQTESHEKIVMGTGLDMVLRTTRQTICTDVCSLGVESAKQNGGDEHIIINNTTYE